ncbi:MAG: hypothetical protein ABIK92_20350 [Pseudomonadota bacterium]
MQFFKYIVKSINLLNISLIIAIIFLVKYAVLPVLDESTKFSLPKSPDAVITEVQNPVAEQSSPLSEFIVIAEQNLFHPDRIIPVENIVSEPDSPTEIVLYGTLITDSDSYAYVEDKKSSYTTPGRGKRQLVLKKGSVIGGYTLTDIKENKIVLVKGEDKLTVNLMDSRKPKTRETQGSGAIKVLSGIMPTANPMGAAFPQNSKSPDEMPSMRGTSSAGRKYPLTVQPSASDVNMTQNAAIKTTTTPYISPRVRARMLQLQNNNTSPSVP